jgi:hypothetical protein
VQTNEHQFVRNKVLSDEGQKIVFYLESNSDDGVR